MVELFADAFPEELPDLPPAREIDFTFDLLPGTTSTSQAPLQDGSSENARTKDSVTGVGRQRVVRPSVSPCGALVLFVKKKDSTLKLCFDYRKLNQD